MDRLERLQTLLGSKWLKDKGLWPISNDFDRAPNCFRTGQAPNRNPPPSAGRDDEHWISVSDGAKSSAWRKKGLMGESDSAAGSHDRSARWRCTLRTVPPVGTVRVPVSDVDVLLWRPGGTASCGSTASNRKERPPVRHGPVVAEFVNGASHPRRVSLSCHSLHVCFPTREPPRCSCPGFKALFLSTRQTTSKCPAIGRSDRSVHT